ncbi:PQQ-binding-like beta-propeller repeat protein [Cellulomonas biazotea]|nr:PQQ-binding-like beta-propeller repeat protein [Cellulomonas biazotea]
MARGMQRVELHDDQDADPTPPVAVRPAVRRARRRLLAAGALAVVATLVLVGTQQVLDQRRRAADAALAVRYADVSGVVDPFGADLQVAWRTDGTTAGAARATAGAGDVVVGVDRVGPDDLVVVGVDRDDGTLRWSTPVRLDRPPQRDERPYWVDPSLDPVDVGALLDEMAQGVGDTWCVPTSGERTLVVCGARRGRGDVPVPFATSVWVLDPDDGTEVRNLLMRTGVWVRPLGDVLVSVRGMTAAGEPAVDEQPTHWSVEGLDLATQQSRWSWTSPPVAGDAVVPEVTFSEPSAGRVLVRVGDTAWVVDADGVLVDEATVADEQGAVLARNGDVRPLTLRTSDDDGLARTEQPATVEVDDGTLPELSLAVRTGLDDTALVARSADGTEQWLTAGVRLPLAVLDGRVLVRTFDGLALVDGNDGSRVWSTRTGVDEDSVATDGRTVLLRTGNRLQALSLESGRPQWHRTFQELGLGRAGTEIDVAPGLRRVVVRTQQSDAAVLR